MKRKASTAKNNGHAKFVPIHSMNIFAADCCNFFFSSFFLVTFRRARKKRVSEDSDEDEVDTGGGEDSDVEMADVSVHRKSDASETEKQTRASRLSARTRAKVCFFFTSDRIYFILNHLTRRRDSPMGALKMVEQYQMNDGVDG